MRLLSGSVVALVVIWLVVDAAAYRGHYRKAAWHEFQRRIGVLHNHRHKLEHTKRAAILVGDL
jgi:hypothetical protein